MCSNIFAYGPSMIGHIALAPAVLVALTLADWNIAPAFVSFGVLSILRAVGLLLVVNF